MRDETQTSLLAQDHDEDTGGEQYLTFHLNNEHYGVNILTVQEIRGWEAATRIPNSPLFVKGVLNLRGNIVPVYDLRLRFGLEAVAYSKETVIIVVRIGDETSTRSLGLIVDAVSDVLVVKDEQIVATPEFGSGVPTENIKGLVADNDNMVMLIDVDSLVPKDEEEKNAA